jgi:hypothetical protein
MAEQPGEPVPAASKLMEIDSDGEDGATPAEIKAKIERDVDELFRSKTIDEVAEIEKKTRQQAEAMDEDIRRTIGGSWREFMQTMKDIEDIDANLKEIIGGFAHVRDSLTELPEIIRKNNEAAEALRAPKEETELTPERAVFAAGSRVKYLVDTPEKIWGALDEREYAEAARRYDAAQDVMTAAEASAPPHLTLDEMVKKFPAFKQQRAVMDSMRAQIARAARKALESPKASHKTIASALAGRSRRRGIEFGPGAGAVPADAPRVDPRHPEAVRRRRRRGPRRWGAGEGLGGARACRSGSRVVFPRERRSQRRTLGSERDRLDSCSHSWTYRATRTRRGCCSRTSWTRSARSSCGAD